MKYDETKKCPLGHPPNEWKSSTRVQPETVFLTHAWRPSDSTAMGWKII